ncbi:MAG: hypothetical protein NVSMB70_01730 [Chamaesiphon sp.]
MPDNQYSMGDGDSISNTEPKRPWLKTVSRGLRAVDEFINRDGNELGSDIYKFMGSPAGAASRVTEDLAYGTSHFLDNSARGRAARSDLVDAAPVLLPPVAKGAELAYDAAKPFSKVTHGQVNMFVPPLLRVDKHILQMAQEMDRQNVNPREIWKQTGFFKSAEGRWKKEVSDHDAAFKGIEEAAKAHPALADKVDGIDRIIEMKGLLDKGQTPDEVRRYLRTTYGVDAPPEVIENLRNVTLEDLHEKRSSVFDTWGTTHGAKTAKMLHHPGLEKEMPAAGRVVMDLRSGREMNGGYGDFSPSTKEIRLSRDDPRSPRGSPRSAEDQRSTALHELQHWIQNREGWNGGSNPEWEARKAASEGHGIDADEAYRRYMNNAGELEARLTQARRNLTPEQRLQIFPMNEFTDTPYTPFTMGGVRYRK